MIAQVYLSEGLRRAEALARERAADLHPRRPAPLPARRGRGRGRGSRGGRSALHPRATCRTKRRRSRTRSTSTSSTRRARTGSTARTRTCATGYAAGLKASSSGPCSFSQSRCSRQSGTAALDEPPEAPRVVRLAQVAELVHDDVVEHLERGEHEPPVERERPGRGARPPARALVADRDARHLDARARAPPRRRACGRARAPRAAPRARRCARGSSPSRGFCFARCAASQSRCSRRRRSISASDIHAGTVRDAGAPHGTSMVQRRARRERRTTTSSSNRREATRRDG